MITFFNAKYAVASLKEEETYLFYGRVSGRIGRREMASPLVFPDDPALALFPRLSTNRRAFLQNDRRQCPAGAGIG